MKIAGIQKLTLLDFPSHTACTVFTAGCNFRCPFCHNSDILVNANQTISQQEFFEFLSSRKGKLDGVCVSGGEPCLQKDLIDFIKQIKQLGFKVKLDTNGSLTSVLEQILSQNLCDYVAMDIKNIPEKYNLSCGGMVNVQNVKNSVELLKNSGIPFEFRTTVVKELNQISDFSKIANWIMGAPAYYLQAYKHSEKVLKQGYSAYSDAEMHEIQKTVINAGFKNCYLRGIE